MKEHAYIRLHAAILLAMIIFNEAGELNQSFWLVIMLIVMSVVMQTLSSKQKKLITRMKK